MRRWHQSASMAKCGFAFYLFFLSFDASAESDSTTTLLPSWVYGNIVKHKHRNTIARNMLRSSTSIDEASRRLQLDQENCEAQGQENEDFLHAIGLQCQCLPREAGTLLACIDDCAYCNEDLSVCGIQSAQVLFDIETGLRVGIGGVFEYVKGFDATSIAIENINCVDENGIIISCETCDVYVNGEKCNSCELNNCTDGGQAETIDCENIERGAVYDFCKTVTINDKSVFTALTPGQFEECVPIEAPEDDEQGKGIKGSKKSEPSGYGKLSKSSKSGKRAKSR